MTDKPVETQETTMPAQEKWEIEVGPITTNQFGEFADVAYAIRYPGGSFRVEQRVNVKQGGYKLAHERIQRIVAAAAPPATETQPVMPEIPSEVFDLVNNLQRRAEDLTGSGATETPAEKLPDFAQTEAKHGIPKWVEVAWRKESERANYNAEAAADNLKALQECQKALAGALSDVVMLRAELSDAKYEIKDLKRGGMSWEDATCGDTEV